jgi:hypothetical protein
VTGSGRAWRPPHEARRSGRNRMALALARKPARALIETS